MLQFWLLIALMLIAGLAIMLTPLLRPPRVAGMVAERDASLGAHRERLRGLQLQHAQGALSEEAFQDARQELQHQVLEDSRTPAAEVRRSGPAWASAAVVVVLVPALSAGLYVMLGTPRALQPMTQGDAALQARVNAPTSRAELEQVAEHVRARLKEDPGDLEGWRLLVRARVALGEYTPAVEASERALALSDNATRDLVDYVEAVSMANQMRFPQMAQTRIEQALARSPDHPRALMLGSLAAIQRGQPGLAVSRLKALRAQQDPEDEQARFLTGLIAQIGGEETATGTPPTTAGGEAPRVVVQVTLSPRFQGEVRADQRVFVFARAATGPPMPLAAVAVPASSLPAQVVLDDSLAMMPGRTLSSANEVLIGARISLSGSATPAAGDLEGMTAPIDPSDPAPVRVLIDRRRP